MYKTANQGYNLIENTDEIDQSILGWNGNFNMLDKTITALEDNFDVDTSPNSNDYTITDSASGYNKGNIKIGDGPVLHQTTTSISGGDEYDSPSPEHQQPITVIKGSNTVLVKNSDNSKSQTYPVTLPAGIFLGKIDTASNYIYGSKDNWKLHLGLGKMTLNGEESWVKGSLKPLYTLSVPTVARLASSSSIGKVLCDYLPPTSPNSIWDNDKDGITNLNDQNGIRIRLKDDPYTLDQFKAWLLTNTPEVYYALATETDVDITDSTLVTQLNDIAENLLTYKGGTIVITSSDNLEPNIQFKYLVNPFASIEARLTLLED